MMEFLGRIQKRKIYYVQVRNNPQWKSSLPNKDWVVFTIANKEDEELVPPAVKVCLDKSVCYTCSAGTLAHRTEDYFDEEIHLRAINYEIETKKEALEELEEDQEELNEQNATLKKTRLILGIIAGVLGLLLLTGVVLYFTLPELFVNKASLEKNGQYILSAEDYNNAQDTIARSLPH